MVTFMKTKKSPRTVRVTLVFHNTILLIDNFTDNLQFQRKSNRHSSNCYLQLFSTNQIKRWFSERGENRSTRGKASRRRVENQPTQSTFDAECGNRTRATLVEGKCSHHYANPATTMRVISGSLTVSG